MTVDYYEQTERWYAFVGHLRNAISVCIKAHIPTNQPGWNIPGAGFIELKCCQLDELQGDHDLVAMHMWYWDHDFIELADAFLNPAGVSDCCI